MTSRTSGLLSPVCLGLLLGPSLPVGCRTLNERGGTKTPVSVNGLKMGLGFRDHTHPNLHDHVGSSRFSLAVQDSSPCLEGPPTSTSWTGGTVPCERGVGRRGGRAPLRALNS